MTYFFGAKRVQNNSYDELLQHDNKMRIWTRSGKTKIMFEWVTKHNANANDDMYACVTLHDTNVNDDIHAWLRTMRTPATTSTERRAHFLGSVVVSSSSHTHALWLKFAPFIPSPYSCSCVRSLHLDPPFLLLALPSAPFPLPQLHEVHGKPAQLLQ